MKIKNEEILSRRGFFKKAAKGTLPMIALIGFGSVQTLFTSQVAAQGCQDCTGACRNDCTSACRDNCVGDCRDNCKGDCRDNCKGDCRNDCTSACRSNCYSFCTSSALG